MRTKKQYPLGLIGCGHMGFAIARGAVRGEYLERRQIAVCDPNEEIRKQARIEGYQVMDSIKEIAEECHIVLLAVKPQEIGPVLDELKETKITTLLSIVTGVSIARLQEALGKVPVIRAMPNTPLQIMEGSTAMCRSEECRADEYDFVFQLFNSMGVTRTVPEEQINASVAVHGSTPAYIYYFAECLINDAVSRGMDEEAARALIVQTIIGAGSLLQTDPRRPISAFIDEVCSKGGTTIEAVNSLREENLAEILHNASEKCVKRAEELGD